MALPEVVIGVGSGLGRQTPNQDNVCGMVMQGVATTATSTTAALALGAIVELNGVSDAEGYGLNTAYDTTNGVLVYHHISRFFSRNKSAKLFLMLVAQTVTLTQICTRTQPYLKALLSSSLAAGRIRQAAVCLNPLSSYTGTLTGGLDGDVITAIPKAEEIAAEEFSLFRPVVILVEGRRFNGTATAATDLRTLNAPNVGVVIAQDKAVADALGNVPNKYYAAVGDVLGLMSAAPVNESLGWVDKYPLTDTLTGRFNTCGLSSNVDISSHEADYSTLHDKGYIFALPRVGRPGFYLNGSSSCVLISNDRAYLENSRVVNKAARIVRTVLVGHINRPIPLTRDGKMEPAIKSGIESAAKAALTNQMQNAGEISDCAVAIDGNHNFITNGEQFDVQFDIVPVGVARRISATITLTKNL
ncbi:DUF2586 family protein [Nodularia spumigena]|jgi:hypothetical protein|uniref:DUF2586 family protein n=1 Tax=Nodularia spumigena TaxID=70799 RepID=UPI00232E1196|nr:DUF2586 family protein [Nodularia spumigena]MDB9498576.1 DUF2586 family protein [Nodularia spumigena CS-336/02]